MKKTNAVRYLDRLQIDYKLVEYEVDESDLSAGSVAKKVYWNTSTGSSKTITVEIAQGSGASNLNDDDIWLEVAYLGTASSSYETVTSDRLVNPLASGSAQATSSETWTGLTDEVTQKL